MRLESKSREKKKLRKKILIWKWKTSDERFIADASALHKLRKKERLNEFRVREKVTGLISWSDKTYFLSCSMLPRRLSSTHSATNSTRHEILRM